MLAYLIASAVALASAAFAYIQGSRADRFGALWFGVTTIVGGVGTLADLASPVFQLIKDGVFALGLLPLAMIYVSYSMGALTLIAAALFSLEAAYLLADRPSDLLYVWINNTLWYLVYAVFLVCGFVNLRRNRRAAKAASREVVVA